MFKTILSCLLLLSSNIFAQDQNLNINNHHPYHETVKQLITPVLIGQYDLRVYGFNVYNIKLFSEKEKFSYDKKFAIEINYKMNFSKKDLVKKTIAEIARIQKITDKKQLIVYEGEFMQIFLDVQKGDSKVAIFSPRKGVDLFFNHQLVGSIADLKLARFFVDIWLSKNSSYPQMTATILGEKND